MVKLLSLKAENFRRLRLREPLNISKGFYVIRGRNEAGKSTILEALLFGLYGDHRIISAVRNARGGLENVVNHRSSRAKVEVVFEVGGRTYKVERLIESDRSGARQLDARLVESSSDEFRLLATGVSRVNEMVSKLLGISWREMLVTNVIAQKDLERIVNMEKRDREAIINIMMGFESYNKAIEKLSEEAREYRRKLEAQQGEKELLEKRVVELEDKARKLEDWKKQLKELEDKIPRLEGEVAKEGEVCSYLEELERVLRVKREAKLKLEALRREIEDTGKRLDEVKARLSEKLAGIERLQRELREAEVYRQQVEQEFKKVESELNGLLELRARVRELWDNITLTSRELEEVEGRISELENRLAKGLQLQREREALVAALREAEEATKRVCLPRWSTLGSAAAGATGFLLLPLHPFSTLVALALAVIILLAGIRVKRKLLGKLQDKVTELKAKISRVEGELLLVERDREEHNAYKERKVALKNRLESLSSQFKVVAGRVDERTEPSSIVKRVEELVSEVEERKREAQDRLSSFDRRLSELKTTVKLYSDESVNLKRELEAAEKKLEELVKSARVLEEDYEKAQPPLPPLAIEGIPRPISEVHLGLVGEVKSFHYGRYSKLRDALQLMKGRYEGLLKQVKDVEEELTQLPSLKARLQELAETVKNLNVEVKARDLAVEVLKRVAARRRAAFAPSVENNMSWIISYITNGRYKAVRIDPQTYEVEVYDAEAGRWMRRDIYSGGTNDQFLLAMRVAFTLSLLPAAKGMYPKFLFLDEPLGSSDSERRNKIVELLSKELTSFFDQVFLITHVDIEEPPGTTVIALEDGSLEKVYKVSEGGEDSE